MKKHLVLAGGGHAHLTVLLNLAHYLERGHRATVIMPSSHQYYSGMGPGMLSGIYRPQEVRFNIRKMVQDRGGAFLEDKVTRINAEGRILGLQSGEEIPYDVVSFNTGSEVPHPPFLPAPRERVRTVKPVINLLQGRQAILKMLGEKELKLLVAGGGAAGVETAANLWRLVRDQKGKARITLIGGRRVLGHVPGKVRNAVIRSFSRRGIEILEGCHLKEVGDREIHMSDGRSLPFDFAFLALGVKPSSLFAGSGLPVGEDGGLLVNSRLQSVAHPEIFGGGDCISLAGNALAKVGVYAVRQNPVLYHNLLAALEGTEMQTFVPQKDYMLIFNLGDGRGILWKKNFVWEGRLAFLLKDYIDRKFMRKFQVSGEREEKE
ncbi:MAG: NAD(P)/FAD-dependent oxidoreductase [Planctomycetaceae bacterium]